MKTVSALVLLLFLTNDMFAQLIDTTIAKRFNITSDGKRDSVVLRVKANDVHSPFEWNLSIWSAGQEIYSYSEDGTETEFKFTEDQGCNKQYVRCKLDYFFNKFVGLKVSRTMKFGVPALRLDRKYSGSVYNVAFSYLVKECHLDSMSAHKATESIANEMKSGKAIFVVHDKHEVDCSLPMVYCRETKCLVPVYSD